MATAAKLHEQLPFLDHSAARHLDFSQGRSSVIKYGSILNLQDQIKFDCRTSDGEDDTLKVGTPAEDTRNKDWHHRSCDRSMSGIKAGLTI